MSLNDKQGETLTLDKIKALYNSGQSVVINGQVHNKNNGNPLPPSHKLVKDEDTRNEEIARLEAELRAKTEEIAALKFGASEVKEKTKPKEEVVELGSESEEADILPSGRRVPKK